MLGLLFSPAGQPYAIALGLLCALVTLEILSAILGAGLSDSIEALIPDGLLDAALEIEVHPSPVSKLLGWLYVGRVPVLMILMCFLAAFGLIGWLGISVIGAASGVVLPPLLSAPATMFLALPATRQCARGLAAILPQDETTAVRVESFVGATARITLGCARADIAAEAQVIDEHGTQHYVRIVPDISGQTLEQGTVVLLVKHLGESRFTAIPAPDGLLHS